VSVSVCNVCNVSVCDMYQDKRDTQKETRDVVDMVYRVTESGIVA
jgi:hypothetical protein